MDPARARLLRQLPQVDELLRHPELSLAVGPLPRSLAASVVRRVLEAQRRTVRPPRRCCHPNWTRRPCSGTSMRPWRPRPTVAAPGGQRHRGGHPHQSGTLPPSQACLTQMLEVASHYNTLEYDLARGPGSRQDHLEGVLQELTGAPGVLVVNNNAAAVLLALNTLAPGKEVIISRGQLVEIGGSFRMPEIMAASGAILREVGTTNKTYLKDFEKAITSETAVLLKVHPSNFRIMGFTPEVALAEMVALAGSTTSWW